ncbi:glycoside hydrolase family 2 [Niabella soli DSM 19437]|uniref:Glycoside hydrolase family 2 n=1 Tax=Niabella soli DSM 19437 TaxID=929713 RepID=W0EZY4_9BACT|nr:glycoside hydrolase family 2 [Niabella soli DSM 19437]
MAWPKTTRENKPWTRWWWEGSAVNEKDLTWNLEQYQQAGLGGVELTPIYGVEGQEKNFVSFLSPRWMELFRYTLKESKRLGLGVDLANATGWPFGGPWVIDADASKTMEYKTYSLKAGAQLKEPVQFIRKGLVRTANNKEADLALIKKPVSANTNLQELALDQIQYPGPIPLISLMAYSNNGRIVDITDKVSAGGKLNWVAPAEGESWTLYALFEGLHGKMVERAAPGGEGYAIDHFSKKAATDYFKKFDKAFKGADISYLRGFFNDSYEVDDARGQANWTDDFFAEFKNKKGYDLRTQLPALFGKDSEDKNKRVLYDYRSVIDQLLLDNFTKVWKQWGNGRGKLLRNQSHGSPANTLDLYSVVDIPETEGTELLRFKFATSAAHVSGKKLVSSESATWLNEHFLSSLGDVKKAIDLYFLGGVNHIFYHGTAYSPKDAAWPGWLFYAAVHFQPVNPQWQHFHALNEYITRVQSFLQKGQPDNDVLLYYPIIDRYSETGGPLLQHFDGMERNFEHTGFEYAANKMTERGVGFDFFSDRQLAQFDYKNGAIITGGNQYKAILLPANKLIDDLSFSKLINLAKSGATILAYKALPADVPGMAQLDARRKRLQAAAAQLKFIKEGSLQKAVIGAGAFYISDDLDALMKAGHIREASGSDKDIFVLRRKQADGKTYFINNRSDHPVEEWIHFDGHPKAAVLFDAMTGEKGLGMIRAAANGFELRVQLQPYASVIVQTAAALKTGAAFPYKNAGGPAIALNKDWKLSFIEGGPSLPGAVNLKTLQPWTELKEAGVQAFSGIASYTTRFKKPGKNARNYLLDLGKVAATAEVVLNGKSIATLIGPSFTTVLPAALLKTENALEIKVANLMANRISYMDKNNMPWKIFYNVNIAARKKENVKNGIFDASGWSPLPSGLLGPVTLTPLK